MNVFALGPCTPSIDTAELLRREELGTPGLVSRFLPMLGGMSSEEGTLFTGPEADFTPF
jgi:hypothetical protein